MTTSKWDWIQQSPRGGIDASALSKLFRNRSDNMGPDDLLAREAIQNSADASKDYRKQSVPFRLRFKFVEYQGKEAEKHAEAFGLGELQGRLDSTTWPESIRPVEAPSLASVKQSLKVLYIEDFGAHGLRGPLDWSSNSDLFNAIYMVGASNKRPDAGGSFGFGKSAVFNAGELRAVYAYSCFEKGHTVKISDQETLTDAASRRAVGFLYWRAHKDGRLDFDGRAEYADRATKLPFEDERADEMAESWGIDLRNSAQPEQHGTTFAVVAPRITPEALLKAIELYWWPAIVDKAVGLTVEVVKPNGEVLRPNLEGRADLKTYIHAFSVAQNGVVREVDPNEPIKSSAEEAVLNSHGPWQEDPGQRPTGIEPGNLGVVLPSAAELGESDPSPTVARIRSTRMVIDYWRIDGRARVSLPLRGVYVASSQEDPVLRKTEDAGHAGWAERGDPPPQPYELAASISQGIREALREICEKATPKSEEKELKANKIGQLLALPGKEGPGDDDKTAPKILIKNLTGSRNIDPGKPTYKIGGTFTVQAAAEQAKKPTTRIRIDLTVRYASESVDPETLPSILSAPGATNVVITEGGLELTLKRGLATQITYEVPRLLADRMYGIKVQPTATILK